MLINFVILILRLMENFWYGLERIVGDVWLYFCPTDKVSYWLDWTPAWVTRQRYRMQNWRTWLLDPLRDKYPRKPPFFIRWLV